MNKENIRKWVDALRSGKYQQVQGNLSNGIGYCCLGVACEVAIENGIALVLSQKEFLDTTGKTISKQIMFDDELGELPDKVAYWLGLVHERNDGTVYPIADPYLPIEGNKSSAIAYNDSGYTFDQIADLIEREYLG